MAFDSHDDDGDETSEHFLMLGFSGVDNLLQFIHWVYETFDDDEDFKSWFETQSAALLGFQSTPTPTPAPALTETENSEFWNIISKSFKNHKGTNNDHFPGAN